MGRFHELGAGALARSTQHTGKSGQKNAEFQGSHHTAEWISGVRLHASFRSGDAQSMLAGLGALHVGWAASALAHVRERE